MLSTAGKLIVVVALSSCTGHPTAQEIPAAMLWPKPECSSDDWERTYVQGHYGGECQMDSPLTAVCEDYLFGPSPSGEPCPTFTEFLELSGWLEGTGPGDFVDVRRCYGLDDELPYDYVSYDLSGIHASSPEQVTFSEHGSMVSYWQGAGYDAEPGCCDGKEVYGRFWGLQIEVDCSAGYDYAPSDF